MYICILVLMHAFLYYNLPRCAIIILTIYMSSFTPSGAAVAEELVALFAGDLNPVAPKAQKKVPVPEGYVCTS